MSMIGRFMPVLSEYWYSVEEDRSSARYSFKTATYDEHVAAEEAAEDYFNNHDGWEARWPRTFTLYKSEHGEAVARLTVDMETQPSFFVTGGSLMPVDAVDPEATK